GAPPGRRWGAGPRRRRAPGLRPGGQDGAGRIGRLLLQRLKPFGCTLLYHDRLRVDAALEEELGAAFEEEVDAMLPKCDVVVLNMPLTDKTRGMFDKEKIAKMKRGVIIVNNARGAVMDTQAVADACRSAHRRAGGDVWYPQPAPKDHPWRYMPNNAMTPHISGITIDAQVSRSLLCFQVRYAVLQGAGLPGAQLHCQGRQARQPVPVK
uniref:D-isomer specific 2-hydroxyacid dehydrogenase NAD-binding domain-containing protein n=1 Tax=Aegilops tauschii subsp. strangulata TaxID=200361 RepID=A0A453LQV7_AEGTS